MLYGITFIDGGYRPAIAKQGRVWTHVVFNDGSVVKVKRTKGRVKFSPAPNYTQRKLAMRFLRAKNALGIKKTFTKAAKAILIEAKGELS